MPTDPHAASSPSTAAARNSSSSSSSSKMQKLLKSAFKRGESPSAAVGEEAAELRLSPSAPGRTPSGRRVGRRRSDDVGDRSSRDRETFVELDGSKEVAALREAKILSAYEAFPFEEKMKSLLPFPGGESSSRFLSLLLLPRATDGSHTRYKSLEDTLARADAWLSSSRASGVPIRLASVQTEALLTKISGESTAANNVGSLSDHMSNASLYGFEDYHGVDIGAVRAVRLWYAPESESEIAVEIGLRPGDTRLGFAISRTEEGFIYVSSVAETSTSGVASTRSGLLELHGAARRASRLLVVSRVGGEKVLPWMVSTAGDFRCYDTVSLSQNLSLHRQALRPIALHFLAWDRTHDDVVQIASPPVLMLMPPPPSPQEDDDDVDGSAGKGSSFTFQNIGLPDSWL